MNTTVNNNSNDQSYGSSSKDNNTNLMDIRMKSIEDQINKLTLTFSRYVKEPITSNNNLSKNQENNNNSDKENEDNDDDSNNDVDIPTEYQLSDSLFNEYKHLLNNQGLLVEEQCILKKNPSEIKYFYGVFGALVCSAKIIDLHAKRHNLIKKYKI
ncbi:hypothetical protein RB653_007960 [Dictyostelium firmibasis]|uniref:Uncharacterized protein n=1 Tax=Dictyostelium firmibasis TaxID=79012 RepID=A0AAN7YS14_9MYCE